MVNMIMNLMMPLNVFPDKHKKKQNKGGIEFEIRYFYIIVLAMALVMDLP